MKFCDGMETPWSENSSKPSLTLLEVSLLVPQLLPTHRAASSSDTLRTLRPGSGLSLRPVTSRSAPQVCAGDLSKDFLTCMWISSL